MWSVRIVCADDVAREGLADVIVAFDKITMLPILEAAGIEFPEAKVRLGLSMPSVRLILLYDGPVLAGYVRLARHYAFPQDMEIGSMQLLPRYRNGLGFGILLCECARLLRGETFGHIRTCVQELNVRAVQIYRKLGLELAENPNKSQTLDVSGTRELLDSALARRLQKAMTGKYVLVE